MIRMRYSVVSMRNTVVQVVITGSYIVCVTERAAVVVMMVSVAVMPVPIVCPTVVNVPPTRVISPVPGRMPCVPCIAPEPIIDHRTIDIYGFDDIVRTIDVLVAYYLNGYLVIRIFLNIYRSHILVDIRCKNGLENHEAFVAGTGLDHTQVVHLSVTVEIQITERAVRVVQHILELFQVLSFCKQFSYNLQIESFGDIRIIGRNRDGFICP